MRGEGKGWGTVPSSQQGLWWLEGWSVRQRQGENQRQKVTERDMETEQGKMETEAEVTTGWGGELGGGTGREGHGERDPQGGGRGTTERVERK